MCHFRDLLPPIVTEFLLSKFLSTLSHLLPDSLQSLFSYSHFFFPFLSSYHLYKINYIVNTQATSQSSNLRCLISSLLKALGAQIKLYPSRLLPIYLNCPVGFQSQPSDLSPYVATAKLSHSHNLRWPFLRVPDDFPCLWRFRCLNGFNTIKSLSRPLLAFTATWGFSSNSPLVYILMSP